MSNCILRMEQITKIYPNGFVANKDVTLACQKESIHALLGENGAGKTTLMKILFGFLSPDKGTIYVKGKETVFKDSFDAIQNGVGMVHQHFMLVNELSVAENMVLGNETIQRGLFNQQAAIAKTTEIAEKYHFDIDPKALVGNCSVAVKQKIEILKALMRGAEILILDEPTAVLTPQEIEELFRELKKLRDKGHTIVFISHKLNEIKELCDEFTILRKGQVVATGMVEKATEQELSRLMVGRSIKPVETVKRQVKKGKELLRVNQVSYTNYDGKKTLDNLSFSLCQGQILGVAGVEGNGQKELCELITGLRHFTRGDIVLEGASIKNKSIHKIRKMGIANISEDRMTYGCAPLLSVRDNIIADRYFSGEYSRGILLNTKAISRETEDLIRQFDVACSSPDNPAGMLSGGNIQKMIAAREFSSRSKVIVACQPTRGIDVGSSMFIHKQLVKMTQEEKVGVLLVSADLSELLRLSDSLLVMFGGKITAYFENLTALSEVELGEYMLGIQKMSPQEIGRAAHESN